jgi:asparagine synthase (glutamine-hydrolysing)
MCGFAGFLGYGMLKSDMVQSLAMKMGDSIIHRGPDDSGVWQDDEAQIMLVHRRLSILDLSIAGHQPMTSFSGRFVLAFNGEIYNHQEIRKTLNTQGLSWRGHSDTETILGGFDRWGLVETLKRTIGMFAIALWDRKERALYLARDRMGEKPLYYGWQGDVFLFGSELKALKAHPEFAGKVDRNAITLQLRHSYIPAPYSIYEGIRKLTPGCFLKIQYSCIGRGKDAIPVPYWSINETIEAGIANPFSGDEHEAVISLDGLLRDAVKQQMVADVPLGAFLSGGVDSSAIVALMQAQTSRPVKTFTVGFKEAGYNEAEFAKAVARYLGTEHTELYVTPEQAMAVIPRLPKLYDEPFSDASQIPTFLISEMTRKHVTVSLSGDAGDELFGGYNRYFKTNEWWGAIQRIPLSVRKQLSINLLKLRPSTWDQVGQTMAIFFKKKVGWQNLGNKINKFADVLSVESTSELYGHYVSHWSNPEEIIIHGHEPVTQVTNPEVQLDSIVEQMMVLDQLSYLPDDILVKVDRAAMGVSLETRVPFLDHRVIEFAWQLPLSMKIRNNQSKFVLRRMLYKYVPEELIERPKMGFDIPIDHWLRGPLREWASSLLCESRLKFEGFFNPEPIRRKWEEHLSGQRNWQYHLWDVLMFQAWFENEQHRI